ncbi:MAG: hypothetical protein KDA37_15035 [Planctomycetales bacterium]|nr:hypothetical protein [Planctomycetales bacterium]
MPSQSYDEILRRAKEELSEAEQKKLASELRSHEPQPAGADSVYDAMARRGLVGRLTSAPADLSTNPIHMEGFGADAE